VTCGAGTHCVGGPCVDDCMGAVCPTGQACTGGTCVPSSAGDDAGGGPGLTLPPADDAGGGISIGDGGAPGANGASPTSSTSSGCGCRAAGARTGANGLAWILALGLAVIGRRRARRARR
jgi:MYXO-CTERM domain-containing protein